MTGAPRQPAVVPAALGGFGEFALERFPFAAAAAIAALESVLRPADSGSMRRPSTISAVPSPRRSNSVCPTSLPAGLGDTTPRVVAGRALCAGRRGDPRRVRRLPAAGGDQGVADAGERREILRGMLLTRATDNRLKTFFTGGEVRFRRRARFRARDSARSGQEAIYAAGIRLRRGEQYRDGRGWTGDVIAPIIRDLGAALAMRPSPETVRMVLSAQMGKAGPPMDGKDLHVGDFGFGILPAVGAARHRHADARRHGPGVCSARASGRVAVSFIGEGGSSLGEWHEAINLCAARKLPAIFCVENNQTALSTPVREQSAVRVFADKAAGYGIPGITIDGTDADEIAAAFAWAAERARDGRRAGADRAGGDAHVRPCPSRRHALSRQGRAAVVGLPAAAVEPGYADREPTRYWSARDPIATLCGAARRPTASSRAGDLDAVEDARSKRWSSARRGR